jgi:hypothetical protein
MSGSLISIVNEEITWRGSVRNKLKKKGKKKRKAKQTF